MHLDSARVVVLGPPWSYCGSYAVFKSQVRAYRRLGASVDFLAVGMDHHQGLNAGSFWSKYNQETADLGANRRYCTGPLWFLQRPWVMGDFLKARRLDYAAAATLSAQLSPLPSELLSETTAVHHVHCNHYFNMPLARRLAEHFDCPIILDSHDFQSYQFILRREPDLFGARPSSLNGMIESELSEMRDADLLLHLNADEMRLFEERLPNRKHILLYPHVQPPQARPLELYATPAPAAKHVLIVASPNYANCLSLSWFLSSVYPLLGKVPVRIVGDVCRGYERENPTLFWKHRALFVGQVDSLQDHYRGAFAVALPTTAGHGISIKTVEALASDHPIVATPLAFRGIDFDIQTLTQVTITDDAAIFAAALKALYAEQVAARESTLANATSIRAGDRIRPRELYERLFSFDKYVKGLADAVAVLRNRRRKERRWQLGRMLRRSPTELNVAQDELISRGGEAFEAVIEGIYRQYLREGDIVLDGGAHVGRHTIPLAHAVGKTGKVIAVEPLLPHANALARHLEQLELKNVHVHSVVLAEVSGKTTFHHVKDLPTYSGIALRSYPGQSEVELLSVPALTIDQLCLPEKRLSFLKLNLQGGEFGALKGARRLLERDAPLLAFENGRGFSAALYRYSAKKWFQFFREIGYSLLDVDGRPFTEAKWDRPNVPWYLIGYRTGSAADHFCATRLQEIILQTARDKPSKSSRS